MRNYLPPLCKAKLACYILFLAVWGVTVLPSAYEAPFGYLDDAGTVVAVRNVSQNWAGLLPDPETGRFQPIYWLGKLLACSLWGDSPAAFYLFQALTVLLNGLIIIYLVNRFTRSTFAGLAAGIFFITGSSIYEAVYTLGKSEIQASLFLFLIIAANAVYLECQSRRTAIAALAAIFICSLCANWTKETLAAASVFWLTGLSVSYMRIPEQRHFLSAWLQTSLVGIAAVIVSRLGYYALRPEISAEAYTKFVINITGIKENLLFYLQQTPDVIFFGLLSAALVLAWSGRFQQSEQAGQKIYIIICGILLTGWGYFLGMLCWRWGEAYYLYIPGALFQTACIVAGYFVLRLYKCTRSLIVLVLLLISIFKFYGLIYGYYVAVSQRINDSMYYEAIRKYAELAKPGDRLLLEQWNDFEEPAYSSRLMLQQVFSLQTEVYGIRSLFTGQSLTEEQKKLYSIKNEWNDTILKPKKGDYILFMPGKNSAYWIVRGVAPFVAAHSHFERMADHVTVKSENLQSKSCLIIQPQAPFIVLDKVYRGYRLYQIGDIEKMIQWSGQFDDGWIGRSAIAAIPNPAEQENVYFEVFVPQQVLPQRLTIHCGDALVSDITFSESGTYPLVLNLDNYITNNHSVSASVDLKFSVSNIFVPQNMGLNKDTRELGLLLKSSKLVLKD
ncbi:MAG TPA: hypothetical protein PKA28_13435 [Methylomusa anaerophila]|uniref:hypothetical protein n=1 Tax=Methylomusa anaerophila TaxID=1930071 RepID=UPI000F84CA47|nr:hypothetical protein [Methylomusa anaerophila]HML89438.1 hypothetical protein [Methylomusa anaerophila]